MGYRRTLCTAFLETLSAVALPLLLTGCAALPPNSFIDPTKVGRFGWDGEAKEDKIRRILSPRETPPGVASATEPLAEDLVVSFSDYRAGPGDLVNLTILDLLDAGQPYAVNVEVSSLGEVRVPELGSVKVSGLTEQEMEQELKARLKESGLLPRAVVSAYVQQKRGRTFNIVGAVRVPGLYPIGYPDTRLLEALGMAGDSDANARKAYVIRREGGYAGPEAVPPATPPADQGWVIPPPAEETPAALGDGFAAAVRYTPPEQEAGGPPTKEELADVLKPGPAQTHPATRQAEVPKEGAFPPFVFDPQTGQVRAAEPNAPAEAGRPGSQPSAAKETEKFEQPFDWEKAEEVVLEQRVIAIDVTELKNGNPRYNIVVRDRDVINVPVDTGIFYMMGEVNRPGVYGFGGREITVKQALAISGGFAPMAWPQRCELIRREPGTDKQTTRLVNLDAIFAGLDEDFYLRDDDVLNVGTHIVAPFLYVIRNSFRFTYGFGFVYDRNFADKDSYGARANPEAVRQAARAARGLSF
jgi:protein involved in polysaccharide export with SLBB domain